MNWQKFHIDVSTIISYLLGSTMLYVVFMAHQIEEFHFLDTLRISIIGFGGLIAGSIIALLASQYGKRKGSYFIAKNFLRYSLAMAVIPHYFYSLYNGIDVFHSLLVIVPDADMVIINRTSSFLILTALVSSFLLLINKTVKWGAVGLLIALSPILILDLIVGSPFTLRDFSLFNAALGFYFVLDRQFFGKLATSEDFISIRTKEVFTEHFLQATNLLKFIFFAGIIVFTYQKHILKSSDIPQTATVVQTIEGKWEMKNISYYGISMQDEELSNVIEKLNNIDTLFIDESQSGTITIKDITEPVVCELSPSNNKFIIFGLQELADFKLSGTYSILSDGQMLFKSDESNISLIFSK